MKRLYILRHAKSSWDDSSLSDFERPLNDRGRHAAPFMGELIAKRDWMPEIFLSSPAERALQTAQFVKDSAGSNAPLILDDRIYEASPQALKLVVSGISDQVDSAMLVGHNPGIEGFIRLATGRAETMPTAAIAVIDFDSDEWASVLDTPGTLTEIVRPKEEMARLSSGTSSERRYGI